MSSRCWPGSPDVPVVMRSPAASGHYAKLSARNSHTFIRIPSGVTRLTCTDWRRSLPLSVPSEPIGSPADKAAPCYRGHRILDCFSGRLKSARMLPLRSTQPRFSMLSVRSKEISGVFIPFGPMFPKSESRYVGRDYHGAPSAVFSIQLRGPRAMPILP